jgi:GAF domain-containing protein
MDRESMKRHQRSLINKLRLPIVGSVVIVLLIMGLVLILIGRQALRQQIFRVQRKTAEEIALSISSYLDVTKEDLATLAQVQDWSKLNREEKKQTLERFWLERQDTYEEITFLDRAGLEIAKISRFYTYLPGELGSQANIPAFQRAVAGEKFLAEELTISPYSGLPVIEMAVPVPDPNSKNSIGVLLAKANIGQMWKSVAEVEVGETGYVYVINRTGRMLAHSDLKRYLELRDEKLSDVSAVQRVRFGLEETAASQYEGLNGDSVVGAFAPIEDTYWFTIVELPTNEAYVTTQRMVVSWLGLMIVTVLAIGGLTSWLPQRIVRQPLAELQEGAVRLSRGDLEHRITLHTRDELETLGNAFNEMASHLQELYAGLEQKVADRTRELQKHATQLEAAAEVVRETVAIHDIDQLLDETVYLIPEQFGFYHAGVFLLDDVKKYAVLKAASSEGGRRMLERGHKLEVGQVGIVGYVAGSGEPRIALDVGEDAVYFDNPDMPETRSEMALPLKVSGEIIGVLDVQSTEAEAFTDEDVAVLQAMADQVALAIENAHLVSELERTVRELEIAQGHYVEEAWQIIAQDTTRAPGYRYRHSGLETVVDQPAEAIQALQEGRPVITAEPSEGDDQDSRAGLAVPIKLRDQTMGVLNLRLESEPTSEDVEMIEDIASRLALALENVRLLEESQRRAVREQTLGRVTARFTRSLDIDTVLQTAVQELGQLLEMDEVSVYVENPKEDADRTQNNPAS